MRYDDERYPSDEEDHDFWDDELELDSSFSPYRGDPEDDTGRDYHDYSTAGGYHTHNADNGENYDNADNDDNSDNDYYSDPEPQQLPKTREESRLGGLFINDDADGGDEDNDFYDSYAEPAAPRKPKAPKLDPEDPDYWMEEEDSPLSGIISTPGKKWQWMLAAAVAILATLIFSWIWFFRPYSDSSVKYGYIKNMERRGTLFKTFEGSMIPYKELGDPDPLYFQEVHFSVESDSLAAKMKRMMLGCVPVRVEYETYHTPLPWKGEQKMIIVRADTADPHKILPPEYRGKL